MNPLRRKLWDLGVVGAWYLRPDQLPIYRHLHEHRDPFLELPRRYGKTTSILTHVVEQLRAHPGWVTRWCEPFKNQCRDIVMPELEKIQADCPDHLKFRFQTTDSVYIGPGNSRIYLRGVNEDRGDSARGSFANIIVADEFGTWKDPEYVVNEALRPQLLTTQGQFIFASTPPKNLGHAYYVHKDRAIRDKRFIGRIITDNKGLTEEQISGFIESMGGINSPAVRRELFCEPVSDPESLVIPEYKEELHDFEDPARRPDFFDAYVGADFGFNDNTALLFGYNDFETQTLVIEDEWVASGKNSGEITEAAKKVESRLWGTLQPLKRVGDNELQQLYDMNTQFGYAVMPTRKDDKIAAINALRIRFAQGRIRIHKRCQSLRFQLKVGLWNERRTDWVRGEKTGHLDAVAALVYLNRNIDTHHNPWPLNLGVTAHTHFVSSHAHQTEEGRALEEAFSPFRRSAGS